MSKLIDRIKLKFIKKEFNKIYNLVLENSNRTDKKSFSDGTPYTKEELNKKLREIEQKLQKLQKRSFTEDLGLMYALTSKAGFWEFGMERLIQLYDKEPEFIQNVIIGCHPYSNTFLRSTYYENYSANMSIDEVIKEWFEIAAEQIEESGIHRFAEIRNGESIIGTDVNGYGENFIKTYPEFFVEDRSLPEKIKQKFYNGELSIEDYEKYANEFEGIMVGIGINDATDFLDTVGIRNFTEIIKEYSDAMKYFQTGGWGSSLDRRCEEFKDLKDIEDIKKKFEDIINDEVEGKRKSVLRGNTRIADIRETDFLRNRLPEFILADDAPQELVDKYYKRSLELTDLTANPHWIKWLEGKDEFLKAQVIDKGMYDDWLEEEASDNNLVVNEYMSILYEKEIRKAIINRRKIDDNAITHIFKERNPDVFYDDLPRKLKIHFENHDWSFEDVFKLSSTMKNLLRNKQIHMAFPFGLEKSFCEKYGGDFGSFEVYEKYAGLMNLLVNSGIDVDEYKEVEKLLKQYIFQENQSPIAMVANTRKENDKYILLEEKIKRAGLQAIKNSYGKYDDRVPDEYKIENAEYFLDVDAPEKLRRIFYRELRGKMSFELLRNNPEYITFLKGKSIRQLFDAEYREFFDYCNNQDEAMRLGVKYGYYVKHLTFYEGEELSKCGEDLLIARIHMRIITDAWDYSDMPDDFKLNYPELFLMDEDLEKMKDIEPGIRDNIKTIFYQKLMSFELLKNYPVLIDIMKSKDACLLHDGKLEDILSKFSRVVGDREKAFKLITGRFAEVFDKIAESPNYEEDLRKAMIYYKEVGFIPDMVVVDMLPEDKIKGFVLNRKLWRDIIKERKNITPDVLGSLLEAAVVMGVFETKEFTRNGKVMVQGSGEAGFKNLQKLLNYSPRYYRAPFSVEEESGVNYIGQVHVKQQSDSAEEVLYEMIEKIVIDLDLIDEFIEGFLDEYDVERIIEDIGYKYLEVEDCFEEDGEDYYHCIVDRNLDNKRKVLLKMLNIKDDEVLSAEEYDLIAQCNENYVKKAFKEIKYSESAKSKKKQDEKVKYKFDISKQGDKFIIADDYNIDEEESKSNKRLFDYVRFLMTEHGLEAEAAILGANNDRSNINLELDKEKMDVICKATNKISQSILDMYSKKVDVWKRKDGVKTGYISDRVIHQLFDGMKMEYNKEFSNFILKNIRQIVEDESLLNKINSMQEEIIKMSKDPDYAGVELTPVMVLKAINKIKYNNKKVGFEKGEELAQKFAFSQEYFNVAQEVWSEARKREASTIPRVYGNEGRYSYEVLRLDDVTGIYAGNITNCCQKLGGVGETAMLHSMQENHGRVFVVRDSAKRIISQSWLWRNGDTICFDNVEVPNFANSQENQDAIYEIMKTVAKELCDKDAEVVERFVKEGKISEEKAESMKAKKVTVGQGNTDISAIYNNRDSSIVEPNCKSPIGTGKSYKGIDEDRLYISDSIDQIILYEAKGSTKEKEQPNIPIHYDENIEKNCLEVTNSELKMMRAIEKEIEGKTDIATIEVLLNRYNVETEELKVVLGTDWFMLYSEKDEGITVHKMLKSPSSGIMKKSIKEQREAVKMLMDKGKNISMEFENDRVHKAARSMVRHMQKRYTMKVADERRRISVSNIQSR